MAMGVLHSRLYRMTRDDEYRKRSVRTADGMLGALVTTNDVYINDRDAWVEGTFVGYWAREVLPLPGVTSRHWTILRNTANSIYANARTTNGFYGGSWSGPAEGSGSAWYRGGTWPQQIMTSATSVEMIVAAAFLESPYPNNLRPLVSVKQSSDTQAQLTVESPKGLPVVIESSRDLANWEKARTLMSDGSPQTVEIFDPLIRGGLFYRAEVLPTEW
jgi:hypothetical protein